jgi:hypothetical protein
MGGEGNSNCGNEKCIQKFWLENLKGRIILEWIFGIQSERVWIGSICLRIGTSGGIL